MCGENDFRKISTNKPLSVEKNGWKFEKTGTEPLKTYTALNGGANFRIQFHFAYVNYSVCLHYFSIQTNFFFSFIFIGSPRFYTKNLPTYECTIILFLLLSEIQLHSMHSQKNEEKKHIHPLKQANNENKLLNYFV